MFRAFLAAFILTFVVMVSASLIPKPGGNAPLSAPSVWWGIQSIDTMKYSRDLSREKLNSISFVATIDDQMQKIAETGATHVAIATPYDDEFVPILTRWVISAREHGLRVWFRGNFSGWERWFDYPAITREQHTDKLLSFISRHPKLFSSGDIFTPCPECENGGPGDPRQTGDVAGHRLFLISEYQKASQAFRDIGKGVTVGYFSMNYDVAKLIMDPATTETLGGVVTIDHYVATPEKLVADIKNLEQTTGGKIFLGEFGVPIPDINGTMSEQEQAAWISAALTLLADDPNVIGVNYWVNVGGSTKLWNEDGSARKAVEALHEGYHPQQITGTVVDQFNKPIADVDVATAQKSTHTDRLGRFILPVTRSDDSVSIFAKNYANRTIHLDEFRKGDTIIIQKTTISLLDTVLSRFSEFLQVFKK